MGFIFAYLDMHIFAYTTLTKVISSIWEHGDVTAKYDEPRNTNCWIVTSQLFRQIILTTLFGDETKYLMFFRSMLKFTTNMKQQTVAVVFRFFFFLLYTAFPIGSFY